MSQVAQFSRYIGLVVLLSAMALLAPRLTVSAWAGLVRGLQTRWQGARAWRRGTVVAEPAVLPVEVRIGDRRTTDPDEVLDASPGSRQMLRELWQLLREALEAGAVSLAAVGLLLRSTSALVARLPEPLVLAGDLLLVLGTFLLMQRIIRDYPVDGLPSFRLAHQERAARVRATLKDEARGRVRHTLEMLLLVPGFLVLVGWPTEIGRFVADKQFAGPQSTVLVVWACELPWLVGLSWLLARPLFPRRAPGRHVREAATVVALSRRQDPVADHRKAA